MGWKLLMIMLVSSALLLSGCAQNAGVNASGSAQAGNSAPSSQGSNQVPGTVPGTAASVGAGASANADASAGGSANAGANANVDASVGSNVGTTATNSGSSGATTGTTTTTTTTAQAQPDFVAMQNSGAGYICQVTTPYSDSPATVHLKGKRIRTEGDYTMTSQGITVKSHVLAILDGKSSYVSTKGLGTPAGDCDWITVDYNETNKSQGSVSEESLRQAPPSSYHCEAATFGDEQFTTPGKVCTYEDMVKAAMGGAYAGAGTSGSIGAGGMSAEQKAQACASITDAQTRQMMGC